MATTNNECKLCAKFAFLNNIDLGLLFLRVAVGGLMLLHGIGKIQRGVEGMKGMMAAKGLPESMVYGAYIGEVVAPILVIIGLATRPAAALIAFTMVLAIYVAHSGDIFSLNQGGASMIELPLFFLLTSVALIFTGSGKYGVGKGKIPLD